MMDIETLKKELANRGLSPAACNAKAIPVVVDILSNTGTTFEDYTKAKEKVALWESKIECMRRDFACLESNYKYQRGEYDKLCNGISQERERQMKEVDKMKEEIMKPETAEARDRIRLAKFYESSVSIQNGYDRSAFIKGLGMILGGCNLPEE